MNNFFTWFLIKFVDLKINKKIINPFSLYRYNLEKK